MMALDFIQSWTSFNPWQDQFCVSCLPSSRQHPFPKSPPSQGGLSALTQRKPLPRSPCLLLEGNLHVCGQSLSPGKCLC